MAPNSNLVTWQVIEIWDSEVPEDVLAALSTEANREDSSSHIAKLEWGDLLILHGSAGYCLGEDTFEVAGKWLEEHRIYHGLGDTEVFRFKIGRS